MITNYLMKTRKYLIIILSLSMGGFSSCKKVDIPLDQAKMVESLSPVQKELIAEAKKYYQQKEGGLKAKMLSTRGPATKLNNSIGKPDWDAVSLLDLNKLGIAGFTEFVRVPLLNYTVNVSHTHKMNKEGFRDLVLRKGKGNDFILNVIEIHPDSNYVASKRKILRNGPRLPIRELVANEDLTGYFLVYSAETNYLMYGERRENGIMVSRITVPNTLN
jgi:hypothetical protein